MTEEAVRDGWLTWLEDLWAKQRTSEFGERFAKFCPCSGTRFKDYWPREIQLDQDIRLIAGINEHHGFFVRIYGQSRMVRAEEYLSIREELLGYFSVFDPTGVRWWVASGNDAIGGVQEKFDETRLLVGQFAALSPCLPPTIGVMRRLTELDPAFYDAYVAMYERFYVEAPHMREVVRTEPKESLCQCARSGTLFSYEIDDELAGVFAASPGSEPPISGWCVIEAILDTPYRRRGLAASALFEMLGKLEPTRSQLIFATIAGINQPSLRTAHRFGLQDVGGWVTLSSVTQS